MDWAGISPSHDCTDVYKVSSVNIQFRCLQSMIYVENSSLAQVVKNNIKMGWLLCKQIGLENLTTES